MMNVNGAHAAIDAAVQAVRDGQSADAVVADAILAVLDSVRGDSGE